MHETYHAPEWSATIISPNTPAGRRIVGEHRARALQLHAGGAYRTSIGGAGEIE